MNKKLSALPNCCRVIYLSSIGAFSCARLLLPLTLPFCIFHRGAVFPLPFSYIAFHRTRAYAAANDSLSSVFFMSDGRIKAENNSSSQADATAQYKLYSASAEPPFRALPSAPNSKCAGAIGTDCTWVRRRRNVELLSRAQAFGCLKPDFDITNFSCSYSNNALVLIVA